MCVFWRLDPNFFAGRQLKSLWWCKKFSAAHIGPVAVYCLVTTSFDFLFFINFQKNSPTNLTICVYAWISLHSRLFRENFKQAAVMLLKRAHMENFILFYLYWSFENFALKRKNSCTKCCVETFDGAIFIESRSHTSIYCCAIFCFELEAFKRAT